MIVLTPQDEDRFSRLYAVSGRAAEQLMYEIADPAERAMAAAVLFGIVLGVTRQDPLEVIAVMAPNILEVAGQHAEDPGAALTSPPHHQRAAECR